MIEGPPVALPRTHTLELLDQERDLRYRLLVAVPDEPPPPGGYPTLYLLDGGVCFGTAVEMVRLRRNRPAMTGVEATVVVGIAHPGVHPWDRGRRTRDYTPGPGGEGDAFGRFLERVVHPAVEERLPTDPARRVLVGHSLAGAFALDRWLESPGSHEGVLAISPSIWAFRERLFSAITKSPLALSSAEPRLFVMVGEYDQALAPWQEGGPDPTALRRKRAERRMVDDAREWCAQLNAAAGRTIVGFSELAGEDHASVLPVALSRALRPLVGIRQD